MKTKQEEKEITKLLNEISKEFWRAEKLKRANAALKKEIIRLKSELKKVQKKK